MGLSDIIATGDRLGPYELLREIGKGGFASVWLARRTGPGGFEIRVAVKLIRTELGTDPSFQKMFIDEARLAAEVSHPNVVSIIELGEDGRTLYLVMEYVRGRTLNVLQNLWEGSGNRIPVEIIVRILSDTCAGLHAAHEVTRDGKPLGVIHRDISPQNILVSDKGVVKLIDFGVAKANDRLTANTSSGIAKGKIRYMAPEQARGGDIDRRADIWSVGAVAYDLLEGHPVFRRDNDVARLTALLGPHAVPPMTAEVPLPIRDVIMKALARAPGDRWATAAEMRAAFERALDASGLKATTEDVATFFGKWLVLDEVDVQPSTASILRERLAPQTHGTSSETRDVPAPRGSQDRIETMSAVNSAAAAPKRRGRMWIPGSIAVVAGIGFGIWRVGASAPPKATLAPMEVNAPIASAPASTPTETAGSPPVAVPPLGAADRDVAGAEAPAQITSITTLTRAPATALPRRPARPRSTGSPKPTGPKPGSPNPVHPKYDDTIQ